MHLSLNVLVNTLLRSGICASYLLDSSSERYKVAPPDSANPRRDAITSRHVQKQREGTSSNDLPCRAQSRRHMKNYEVGACHQYYSPLISSQWRHHAQRMLGKLVL